MSNKVFWGILVVIVIGFGVIFSTSKKSNPNLSRDDIKTIEGVQDFGKLDNKHQEGILEYPQSPPAGGNHNPTWVGCDQQIYDQPIQKEKGVHALEHGAVWIARKADLPQDQTETLSKKVKSSGATFMSTFEEQKSPIVLTAWSKQLEVNDANDPRIDQFLVKYRKSPDAPEPGATCADPGGGSSQAMPQGGTQQPSSGDGLAPGETQEQHDKEQQQGQPQQ